jgi:hypothetical protein
MSKITYSVSRNGKVVGNFEYDQLRQMYETGVMQASDHAWTEGMKEWTTLAALFPAMSPPPVPPRPSAFPAPAPVPAYAPQPRPTAPNGCLALVVPVGRSGWAIAAGYFGLLSILVLPAPFAIWFGVLALRDIKKNPEKMGMVRAWFGILAGSFVILFVFIGFTARAFTS